MNELVRKSTEIVPVNAEDAFTRFCECYSRISKLVYSGGDPLDDPERFPDRVAAALGELANAETFVAHLAAEAPAATQREIAERLTALSGAIPNGDRVDPVAYGKMLAVEVTALRPSKAALSAACRELIRTFRWLPAIADVLEAIQRAERTLQARRQILDDRLPKLRARAIACIEQHRAWKAAAAAKAKAKAERAADDDDRNDLPF